MLPSNKYKHLFFDLDHTLWDFETNSELTMRKLYIDLQMDLKLNGCNSHLFFKTYSVNNAKMWGLYENGEISRAELRINRFMLTLKTFGCSNWEFANQLADAYLEVLPTYTHLFDGTIDLLDYLQPKYQLHLITNGFTEVQNLKLNNTKIQKYFTHVVTSEAAKCNKPDPAIFKFALEKANALASNSLMIGDNPKADIQGAANVGIDTVWFNTFGYKATITPTLQINSLLELQKIL
jgi:putative hydrolase of the HAD superfamily